MKKLSVFALTGIMMLGLTACGGGDIAYDVDINSIDDYYEDDQGVPDDAEYIPDQDYDEYDADSQGVPDDVEYIPDQDYSGYDSENQGGADEYAVSEPTNINALLAGSYIGDDGVFTVGYDFTEDGYYSWWADGGASQDGSYDFDGVNISVAPAGGGQIVNLTMDDNGDVIDENGIVYHKQGVGSENAYEEAGGEFTTQRPIEEYGSNPDDISWFVGYWEGNATPPVVWYLFTADGYFYCNRGNDYLEKGTFIVHPVGLALLTYDSGEQEELFNFDTDYISYTETDGLSRTSRDDTVEQWILDSF